MEAPVTAVLSVLFPFLFLCHMQTLTLTGILRETHFAFPLIGFGRSLALASSYTESKMMKFLVQFERDRQAFQPITLQVCFISTKTLSWFIRGFRICSAQFLCTGGPYGYTAAQMINLFFVFFKENSINKMDSISVCLFLLRSSPLCCVCDANTRPRTHCHPILRQDAGVALQVNSLCLKCLFWRHRSAARSSCW